MRLQDLAAARVPVHRADAAHPQRLRRAVDDLVAGVRQWRLAWALAALDLRNRYRGSGLGPFWLTLSTAIMVGGLGFLYARLFKLPLGDYLPYLAVSLIVWGLISQAITDSCTQFVASEPVIRQLRLPFTVYALRCVVRNVLTAAHSLPLALLVLAIFGQWPGAGALPALFGLLLVTVTIFCCALLLGMACARFRDIPPIVGNAMQLAFFVSPIIWKPELLGEDARWLLLNPFYCLLETVRAPLLGQPFAWPVWACAFGFTALLAALSFAAFVRFRGRIAFWV